MLSCSWGVIKADRSNSQLRAVYLPASLVLEWQRNKRFAYGSPTNDAKFPLFSII